MNLDKYKPKIITEDLLLITKNTDTLIPQTQTKSLKTLKN